MIERSIKRLSLRALVVDDELGPDRRGPRGARAGAGARGRALEVVEATSAEDGKSVIMSDSAIHAVLDGLDARRRQGPRQARAFLEFVRSRNDKVPIFLMAERGEASAIPIDVMEMVDEYIWTLEDTAAFVGGRVAAAIRRYLETMLPPLAAALMQFTQEYEYSWHTPGHAGGTAFLKSPVGRIFFDYFGENLLRSDLSISVGRLGSLLDHTGPIGEHEKYAARVFGAHRTYCVTNGTSMSNRVIFMAAVGSRSDRAVRSQLPQVDRARPGDDRAASDLPRSAAQPLRHHRSDSAGATRARRRSRPRSRRTRWSRKGVDTRAVYSVDHELDLRRPVLQRAPRRGAARSSVDRIHFDEAWYAYARFNRSTAIATPCTAIRRITRVRRCSPRIRRTSCSPRCRRHRSCTSATGAARSRTRDSTSRT